MTTAASWCAPGWWRGPRPGRCATPGPRHGTHGVPEAILTDNAKVFTARFGPGPGPVRFDRICVDNGIRHLLTAPRSPTTTGKVERWHKTLRGEFLTGKVFASLDDAQAQLDAWVQHYNHQRPHQSIGRVPPFERFRLAAPDRGAGRAGRTDAGPGGTATTRRVSAKGTIGFATASYKAGAWLAGQTVEVRLRGRAGAAAPPGVLIATHARRHPVDKQTAGLRARPHASPPAPPSATAASVTRKVDSSGNVCFAGTNYRVGANYRRRQVQVAVVGDTVEISIGNQLIRSHAVRHDRTREHGALANPGGRPHRINAA